MAGSSKDPVEKVLSALGNVEKHGEGVFARIHGALEDEYSHEMLRRDEASMKALLATLDSALQEHMLHTLCPTETTQDSASMLAEFEARATASQSAIDRVRRNSQAVRVAQPPQATGMEDK
jgi:hypothetical protein